MLNGDAEKDDNDTDTFQDDVAHENAAPRNVDSSDGQDKNENIDADVDYDKDDTNFEADVGDLVDINVDGSVVTEKGSACKAAKEQAMEDKGLAYEEAYSNIYILQDLSDFPGNTKVSMLLSTNCPQWQLPIQNQLLWSHM
ncbi:uncharacterized protein HD556DRAFT_1305035 [Suillus plorans]|uniref:Uncharacterized protein n=1 Tax=Suillus plorans TaxID=116603 RepID=A0A9P7DQ22_9AGAM|nr:uncharacterized protein HD556DRAFT_1305035 [Suillus plorans]KAG1800248.1 hypothetical protein HD556DRAFT_1305035 [Suillus plorans]